MKQHAQRAFLLATSNYETNLDKMIEGGGAWIS